MEEISAAGRATEGILGAEILRRLKQRLALQIWLPPQPGLCLFRGTNGLPRNLSVSIDTGLSDVMPQFISHVRPVHKIRRMLPRGLRYHLRILVFGMKVREQRRSVSVNERHSCELFSLSIRHLVW